MSEQVLKIAVKVDDNGSVTLRHIGEESEKAGVKGEKGMRKLRKGIADLDAPAKKSQSRLEKMAAAIADLAQKTRELVGTMAKIGAAGAVAAFALISKNALQLASDMEETQGKFNVVFRGMTDQAEQWSKVLVESYAMSELESKKYLSSLQDLIVPTGMARDAAGELSNKFVQMAADLGSFNNFKTADVIMDMQSALQGSSETMAKYGINVKAVKIEQEVLNSGLALSKKGITDAHKAQALYNIIMREGADAVGDQQRTMGSFANQMKRLHSNLEGLQITIGQALLPTMTDIVTKTNEWLKENDDIGESVATLFKAIALGATKALTAMSHVINSVQVLSLVFASESVDFADWLFGSPEDMQRILTDAESGVLTLREMRSKAIAELEALESQRAKRGRNRSKQALADLNKEIASQRTMVGIYTNKINQLNYNLAIHGNIEGKIKETSAAVKDLNANLNNTGSEVEKVEKALKPVVDDFHAIHLARQELQDIKIDLLPEGFEKDLARSARDLQQYKAHIVKIGNAAKLTKDEINLLLKAATDQAIAEELDRFFDDVYGPIEQKTEETSSFIADRWKQAYDSIQGAIADMIYQGKLSLDSLVDIFKRALSDIVAAIAMSGIKGAIAALFDGNSETSLLGGLLGGIKDSLGIKGGGSIVDTITGLFSPAAMGEQIPGGGILGGTSILAGLSSAVEWLGEATGLWGEAAEAAIQVTDLTQAYMAANPMVPAGAGAGTTPGAGSIFSGASVGGLVGGGIFSYVIGNMLSGLFEGDRPMLGDYLAAQGATPNNIAGAGMGSELMPITDELAGLIPVLQTVAEASIDVTDNLLITTKNQQQAVNHLNTELQTAIHIYDDASGTWSDQTAMFNDMVDQLNRMYPQTEAQVNEFAALIAQQNGVSSATDELVGYFLGSQNAVIGLGAEVVALRTKFQQAASDAARLGGSVQSMLRSASARSSNSIQYHADGYVFDRPVQWGNHVVGEAGTEILAPEDMLRRIFAEAGGNNSGGTAPVVHVTVNARIGERELTDISYETSSRVYDDREAGKNQYVMEEI